MLVANAVTDEQLAEGVYTRLVRAAGILNPPSLVVQPWRRDGTERVAFLRFIPGPLPRREIVVDDKVISICQSMGDQAEACLAYFLGHELAHFANNHGWGAHFARRTIAKSLSAVLSVELETQADRFGGFYASLAGYETLSVAGRALELVYQDYKIDSDLAGYLSLAERRKAPEEAREFLSKLLPIFDAAGLLMALEHYREAADLYGAILEHFPSREIYNNAGVALVSEVDFRRRQQETGLRATTPWLLDDSTRLPPRRRVWRMAPGSGTTLQGGTAKVFPSGVASRVREYFEKAIFLDREYAVAHLNLGLLLEVIGDEPGRGSAELFTAARLAKGNATIEAIARGEVPPTGSNARNVPTHGPSMDPSALLPGRRRPADSALSNPNRWIQFASGIRFYSEWMDDGFVFSVELMGNQGQQSLKRKRLFAVFVPQVPEAWQNHLGPGRVVHLFPKQATLFEKPGVLIGSRGALVYQIR